MACGYGLRRLAQQRSYLQSGDQPPMQPSKSMLSKYLLRYRLIADRTRKPPPGLQHCVTTYQGELTSFRET